MEERFAGTIERAREREVDVSALPPIDTSGGSLTPAQVEHYRREGYVTLSRVVAERDVERLRIRAREIVLGDHPAEAANRIVRDIAFVKGLRPLPADPEHAVWKLLNPDRFDPTFREAMRLPGVLDAVESLIGHDLMAFLMMFIYKPPGVPASVHPFHQDALYFMFEPQDRCLGVWIPLDPVDAENGTLEIVPGSHRSEVRPHEAREGINFGAFAAAGVEGEAEFHDRAMPVELEPGDCLLFDTRLLHRSGGNRTERHRRVITLHMASTTCALTGAALSEYGFEHVRGRLYEGCLAPVESPSLRLVNARVE
jgi:phytanoyl-CoA hydroxylase